MTDPEVTEFAARITKAIMPLCECGGSDCRRRIADRERVRLDLAGYLRALDGLADHRDSPHANCGFCADGEPCPDALRYAEDRDGHLAALTLTGSAYGVTP